MVLGIVDMPGLVGNSLPMCTAFPDRSLNLANIESGGWRFMETRGGSYSHGNCQWQDRRDNLVNGETVLIMEFLCSKGFILLRLSARQSYTKGPLEVGRTNWGKLQPRRNIFRLNVWNKMSLSEKAPISIMAQCILMWLSMQFVLGKLKP